MPPKKAKKEFRFQNEKDHFTYPTHLDEDAAMAMFKTFGEFKMYSFVHELGDSEEDAGYPDDLDGEPYAHTHVFVWWKKKIDVTNVRAFDLKQQGTDLVAHPNIQNKRGMVWAKTICMKYHEGFKTTTDGKKYLIAPIFLH